MTTIRKGGADVFDASRREVLRALHDPRELVSPGISSRTLTPAGPPNSTTEVAEVDATKAPKGGHVLVQYRSRGKNEGELREVLTNATCWHPE